MYTTCSNNCHGKLKNMRWPSGYFVYVGGCTISHNTSQCNEMLAPLEFFTMPAGVVCTFAEHLFNHSTLQWSLYGQAYKMVFTSECFLIPHSAAMVLLCYYSVLFLVDWMNAQESILVFCCIIIWIFYSNITSKKLLLNEIFIFCSSTTNKFYLTWMVSQTN